MSASALRRPAALLFAALLVCSLSFTFSFGHLLGRWQADRDATQGEHVIRESQRLKEDEYVELRKAVEHLKERSPAEEGATIDKCLVTMRKCREERSKPISVAKLHAGK